MHGPDSVLAGRYRLHERIGAGGMGEVWRATDETLGRTVAVKVMQPGLLEDPSFDARFRAEARMMAGIHHPGVVAVHDYHRGDDIALLVMDFVPGESLARLLARQGRLPAQRTMEVIAQAADALHAAHQMGVVHRDVKPANLLIRPDGTVVLTDFGIARAHAGTQLTATGAVLGTLSYLAPEQVLGDPATPRSDVYALGVVAYECLAGRRPFEHENPFASAMARVREAPPTLAGDVPSPVAAVVEQALAADPARRPSTAAELAAACRRAAAAPMAGPVAAPAAPAPPPVLPLPPPAPAAFRPPAGPKRRRGLGLAIAGGATGMAVVLVAGIVLAYNVVASLAGTDAPEPTDGPAPPLSGCEPFAAYQGHDGTTVTIGIGQPAGPYADASRQFTDCTGIDVEYTELPFEDFRPYLETRITAGEPPDLAFVTPPSWIFELAGAGTLVPAAPEAAEAVAEGWAPGYRDVATVDGVPYGVPLSVAVHSLVWYSTAYFAENSYDVPETWDEMIALSETIAAAGDKPWCDGWEERWPSGYWVADAMLRRHGPDVYEQWWRHEVPSDDDRVVEALDVVGEILKNPDFVNGGVASIAETPFQGVADPFLAGDCAMYRQADFFGNTLADHGAEVGQDGQVWAFPLPPMDGAGPPVVVSGEFAVAFSDRPEVAAVHAYLASTAWASARIALGDWTTGNQNVDPADAADPLDRAMTELLQSPDAAVHFGPDSLMPPQVYTALWDEMASWIEGQDSRTTAANLEAAWP